ncbi:MAG: hypothetical protein QME51_07545 [Planctomycetota bacterium]|nr:hypothetical protein [Planctomycetota bacterium]MDI6788209.1 hypothetical protein [Planctomycetota bacterium]
MMGNKVWINIAHSLAEAEQFDRNYYRQMTPQERLDTIQFLREQYHKLKGLPNAKSRKRLRRTVEIVKQKQG